MIMAQILLIILMKNLTKSLGRGYRRNYQNLRFDSN